MTGTWSARASSVTSLSPTASTPLDHQDQTCVNRVELDHVDVRRRFCLPVPGRAEGRSQDQDRRVFGPVKAVLQGALRCLTHSPDPLICHDCPYERGAGCNCRTRWKSSRPTSRFKTSWLTSANRGIPPRLPGTHAAASAVPVMAVGRRRRAYGRLRTQHDRCAHGRSGHDRSNNT